MAFITSRIKMARTLGSIPSTSGKKKKKKNNPGIVAHIYNPNT
jgi:hypothetical protein